MELKHLKPKLGSWLSIEELKGFLAETPEEICQGIPINRRLLEIASEFVEERHGWWEHPDWEAYLERLQKEGYSLSESCKVPIGSILEIFKDYYHRDNFQAISEKRRKPGDRNTRAARPSASSKRPNSR